MEPKSTMEEFYRILGRVFCATARADNDVHEDEVATLKQVLVEEWKGLDSFGSEAIIQIQTAFDQFLESENEEKNVLDDLEGFKSQYPDLFSKEHSKLIMDTASKIASSFAKRNKSELVFLSQLFLILKKQ